MFLPIIVLAIASPTEGELEVKVREVFDDACTLCHDSSDELNLEGVTLERLAQKRAASGEPMVDPGHPEESYLYRKLVGAEGIEGDPMPLDEEPLSEEQLGTLLAWISSASDAAERDAAGTGDTSSESAVAVESAVGASDVEDPVLPASTVRPQKRRKKPFFGTHQINLQTTTTLGKNVLAYRIHHRFGRFGSIGERAYAGLANGVVMSMGVEYGIVDGLDVLVRWSSSRLDWELGAKYVALRQEEGAPLSLGLFASFEGISDFPENAKNRATGNVQLMASRLWFERWSTQLTLGYSPLTNHATKVEVDLEDGRGPIAVEDRRGTANLGLASTFWFGGKRRNGLDLEYILPIPDGGSPNVFYFHGGDADPQGSRVGSWSLGWSRKAGLHLFQILVTNTRNIHTNLVAPGGDTKNPFKPFGDFFLGFNLSRKWNL